MDQFAIDGVVKIETGEGGLPKLVLTGEHGAAEIYLHGAHVTSFTPGGQPPMLWMSHQSNFSQEKAIRGGVPICWPWFGKPDDRPDGPQHGFARTSQWQLVATKLNDDGTVSVQLQLTDSEQTHAIWPHAFELTMEVIVGKQMTLRLSCRNTGDIPLEAGAALHTYFAVDRIEDVVVSGLAGRSYVDQLDGNAIKTLDGDIVFDRETDLIVIDSDDEVVITEASLDRRIHISKTGSASTVVWNPWIEKSKKMSDFPDDGYKTMLCIETTNAATDVRTVGPGETHVVSQTFGYV